jgi:hypothetical protein
MKLGEQNVSDLYIGLVKERKTWSSEKEMFFWCEWNMAVR